MHIDSPKARVLASIDVTAPVVIKEGVDERPRSPTKPIEFSVVQTVCVMLNMLKELEQGD
jgi:hypothetical protein